MELLIVVVIIGIIAAFAIPNYKKAIAKARERSAVSQLMTLHAANQLYKAQTNSYWQANSNSLKEINQNLGISLLADGFSYSYSSSNPETYETYAAWNKENEHYTIRLTEEAIFTESSDNNTSSSVKTNYNPCCFVSAGTCPSLPSCT